MTAKELLPCPFCGGTANKVRIGNDYTKKRSVVITCTNKLCRTEQRTGAIHNSHDWCDEVATKKWNTRPVIAERMPTEEEAFKQKSAIIDKIGLKQSILLIDIFDVLTVYDKWFRSRMEEKK
jgi:hypothetical protein